MGRHIVEDIILIGGGKHCQVVIDLIRSMEDYNVWGISDKKEKLHDKVLGVEINTTDDILGELYPDIGFAFITHGKDLKMRGKLFSIAENIGFKFPILVSKSSKISESVIIGDGSLVMHGAIINPKVEIAENCIINSGAIIEHDCKIGEHVHLASGSVLSGSVRIGRLSLIGANSTIIPGINIGKESIIGAGSVVKNDVPDSTVFAGNPAKLIKKITL
jgi:UDP-perosamine 4-acetyltransferase